VGVEDFAEVASRLVAGEALADADERVALVNELVVYQWGMVDEADVASAIGRKLRLEFRSALESPSLLMQFFGNRGGGSREDEQLLERLLRQLPQSLDKFEFSPAERDSLAKLLTIEARPAPPPAPVFAEEFVIKGVVRLSSAAERGQAEQSLGFRDSSALYADAWLPQRTAERLFEKSPMSVDGYFRAFVRVDQEEHAQAVLAALRDRKIEARAPIDFIEREQMQYAIIFHAMACIAATALAVAAIGIANTMLMSVLERTREIGILKALGARDRDISRMFLLEGALIGLAGGCLGLVVARLASIPADESLRTMVLERFKVELTSSLFVFPAWIAAGSVAFATLATTLAAVQPARRAARINPIAALRHE
jgi:putative ABC transport system permease protein